MVNVDFLIDSEPMRDVSAKPLKLLSSLLLLYVLLGTGFSYFTIPFSASEICGFYLQCISM